MNDMSRVLAARTSERPLRKREIAFLLCGFGLLIALRLPNVWIEGRFLDEEATVFLSYAWNFPASEALFRSFAGYLNLAANGVTLLVALAVKGSLLPLSQAPYVTMLTGLLFQLAPVLLLLTGKAAWLPNRDARLIAALMVVLAPGTEEVYLNVMHIQFHLALCVAIMLGLDVPDRARTRFLYGLVLVVAPLCGPGAIVVLPLFVLRAIVDRSSTRAEQAALLAFGTALQLLLFYAPSPIRGLPTAPLVLGASLFIRLIALPLSGPLPAGLLGLRATESVAEGGMLLLVLTCAVLLLMGGLLWWCLKKRDSAIWMLAAALLIAGISLGLGIAARPDYAPRAVLSGIAGPRYNFLPLVLLGLTMVVLAGRGGKHGKVLAKALIVNNILVSAFFFRLTLPFYTDGPSWQREVARWEKNPDHPLAVWPKPYAADLSGRARPCTEEARPPGDPLSPRYCENGWLAGFYPHVHARSLGVAPAAAK